MSISDTQIFAFSHGYCLIVYNRGKKSNRTKLSENFKIFYTWFQQFDKSSKYKMLLGKTCQLKR